MSVNKKRKPMPRFENEKKALKGAKTKKASQFTSRIYQKMKHYTP